MAGSGRAAALAEAVVSVVNGAEGAVRAWLERLAPWESVDAAVPSSVLIRIRETPALLVRMPDRMYGGGASLLGLAARYGQAGVVRLLLAAGASPDRGGRQSPLHEACCRGWTESVELLLAAGAQVNVSVDDDGFARDWTPLMVAAVAGATASAEAMVRAGADLRALGQLRTSARDGYVGGMSVLQMAVNERSGGQVSDVAMEPMVRLLLRLGADPNTSDDTAWTPLCTAASRGDLPRARALLEGGARPDTRGPNGGKAALCVAAENDEREMVMLLLGHGAGLGEGLGEGAGVVTDLALRNVARWLWEEADALRRSEASFRAAIPSLVAWSGATERSERSERSKRSKRAAPSSDEKKQGQSARRTRARTEASP